jgi:hypothetical protein
MCRKNRRKYIDGLPSALSKQARINLDLSDSDKKDKKHEKLTGPQVKSRLGEFRWRLTDGTAREADRGIPATEADQRVPTMRLMSRDRITQREGEMTCNPVSPEVVLADNSELVGRDN